MRKDVIIGIVVGLIIGLIIGFIFLKGVITSEDVPVSTYLINYFDGKTQNIEMKFLKNEATGSWISEANCVQEFIKRNPSYSSDSNDIQGKDFWCSISEARFYTATSTQNEDSYVNCKCWYK